MKYFNKYRFLVFLLFLFLFRTIYGLCSQFWFEDEIQIYLIGLKSFTSNTWPYYGPDVVYTYTQIPGALQGLLISLAFYLVPIPESPIIFLNILTFLSLSMLAHFVSKKITKIPKWLIFAWIMTLTWSMEMSTRVLNPSYIIIFSIPFFIAVIDLLPVFPTKYLPEKLRFFILGAAPMFIMQLHLSFVLLLAFYPLVLYFYLKKGVHFKGLIINISIFIIGVLFGISTLIPSWFVHYGGPSVSSNIVFNFDNIKNIINILAHYLSFASYDIIYTLGGNSSQRLAVLNSVPWIYPFAFILLTFGILWIIVLFIFLIKKADNEWNRLRLLTIYTFLILFLSFFFSIKGPSTHTFYLLFPLPVMFSFFVMDWIQSRRRIWNKIMIGIFISSLLFNTGLAFYNFKRISLYTNREKVVNAIEKKNYKLLQIRRSDKWGYGY